MPRLGRGNGFFNRMVDSCHVLQEFAHLPPLPAKLFLVVEMLVLTPATGGEERAVWLLTTGTGIKDLQQVSMLTTGFVLPEAGPHPFAGQAERDEDDPAPFALRVRWDRSVDSTQAHSQVGKGIDFKFDDLMVGKRFRPEVFRGFFFLGHSFVRFRLPEGNRTITMCWNSS